MAAQQAPLSLGFSRQEYWSGLPFPSPMHETEKWKWSHSVMSNSSPTSGVSSNSCPLSRWCHPTVSSSVVPFSSHLQSFPASGSSPMIQFFALGGQSIGISASALVLPMNIQDSFPLGLSGLISLLSKELSRDFSSTIIRKASVLQCSAFFMVELSHPCMTTGKTIALTIQTYVALILSISSAPTPASVRCLPYCWVLAWCTWSVQC